VAGSGSCLGNLTDTASVGGNFVSNAGAYSLTSSNVVLNVGPMASCGAVASCTFLLAPGQYTLSSSISDAYTGVSGGVPQPFSETFTAILTVNSGNVLAPEPATSILLSLSLAAGLALREDLTILKF
jgi:hypothetical protein